MQPVHMKVRQSAEHGKTLVDSGDYRVGNEQQNRERHQSSERQVDREPAPAFSQAVIMFVFHRSRDQTDFGRVTRNTVKQVESR